MIKISYQKEWGEHNGTVYSQTINASGQDFNKIVEYMASIKKEELKDIYDRIYFKQLAETPKKHNKNNTKYFLNLTQLKFIARFLNYPKRLLDRNTILKFSYKK